MALLAQFEGYFPGYSRVIAEHHDYLTWAVLKAHTNNRAGEVHAALGRSARHAAGELPLFRGRQRQRRAKICKAVVTAFRFVRRMTQRS